MKKSKLAAVALSVTALTLTAACGGGEAGSDGDTITLRVATGLSDQHAWWAATMVPWMDRVEELTDGKVEFETFTGGELVEVPDEAEAILNGTADVALLLPIYTPDQFPMAEVTMLPVQTSDTMIASRAWKALLESDVKLDGKTYYESQFGDKGIKAWPVSATQEYAISTTGATIETVADVESLSLRTPSRIHEMYAKATGIDSVTIPAVEMFDALSRGSFDGSFYSIADWSGYGFQDLFKYTLTGINFGHFNSTIGMTDATWDGLPSDVQEAMDEAHEDVFEAGAQEWIDRSDEMIKYNTAKGGEFVGFNTLDQEVQDHFLAGIDETWTGYVKQLDEAGLPGEEVVELWRDLLVEAGGSVPEDISVLD